MKMKKYKKIIAIVLIIITSWSFYAVIKQEFSIYELGNKGNELELVIKKEKDKNTELLAEKEALNHNEYIEKVAREDLGMTKPGEIPYIQSHKE